MLKRVLQDPRYDKGMTYLAIVYVLLIVLELIDPGLANSSGYNILDWLLWFTFVVDYILNLYFSEDRGEFIQGHVLELIAIIPFDSVFSFLRLGRLARLFRLVKVARIFALSNRFWDTLNKLMHTNSLSKVLLLNVSAVLTASVLLSAIEGKSFFDAVWWSIVTMTTVGYGDIVPQDTISKVIAILLMLVGISTFGMVTSSRKIRYQK
ncbi:Kef-type K+ transporter NAD-binding component [Streptococcus suis]|uniref:Kef-type K+ transporter NAD-binding component n=1 Tax=Streptococcus suis TaxID=1307 RepID=A0A0Z8IDL0_STRSU|nr:potassium channel family protein [Streptococcus suis]CYV33608.1 Kef-type K+ transporter NAD-binding component [Streptococcus suis]